MKYKLVFECTNTVMLPLQHNRILQAAILAWLGDEEYSEFLHDKGYMRGRRTYKLFTFSDAIGHYTVDRNSGKMVYDDRIVLYISFYTDEAHELVLDNIDNNKPLRLGSKQLPLIGCYLAQEEPCECDIDTVSPITVHSTFELVNGKKKTYYYEPYEKDFSMMIRQNLIRKWESYYGTPPQNTEFEISVVRGVRPRETRITYNRFVIKGWSGRFHIKGSKELIEMALLSGLGSRNGIGFGCVLQRRD